MPDPTPGPPPGRQPPDVAELRPAEPVNHTDGAFAAAVEALALSLPDPAEVTLRWNNYLATPPTDARCHRNR